MAAELVPGNVQRVGPIASLPPEKVGRGRFELDFGSFAGFLFEDFWLDPKRKSLR